MRLIVLALAAILALPTFASAGDLTDIERLELQLKSQIKSEVDIRPIRVNCPDDAKFERKGCIVRCRLSSPGNDVERAWVVVLILDRRHGYDFSYGTYLPTTRRQVREWYGGSGLFCRDLKAQDAPYFDAVMYWFAEGKPDRMDADLNGIPCETVYSARAVNRVWAHRHRF